MMFIKAWHLMNKDKHEVAALIEIFPAEMLFQTVYLHLSTRFPKYPRSIF